MALQSRVGSIWRMSVAFACCAAIALAGCRSGGLPDAHVVIIGVDGLSPDGLDNAATPNLDALVAEGAYARARAVLPTVSSPNWASIINGAGPEQHGVLSNDWRHDEFTIAPPDTGLGSVFPSIFDLVALADPAAVTASIYDWGGFGRLYNRAAVTVDIDADGAQAAADSAAVVLRARAPALTFVHLDHVDHAGHSAGHGSPEYYAAVAEADRLIGTIVDAVRDGGMYTRTTFIVTSDHGGEGTGHSGESMANLEVPWIISGRGIRTSSEPLRQPVDTYDTAPTVAQLLGLHPPDVWVGRPAGELLADGGPASLPPLTEAGIDHVVVIGVDALSPDGVQKAHTPVLNSILPAGAYSFDARGVLTTSSSQNWASMIMGAGPEQHGITSNAWQPDSFAIHPTAQGPEGLFPSIFSEVRAAEPNAYIAAVYDWGGFGRLFPASTVNASIDGDGPEETVNQANALLLEHQPRLMFVHLDHVDYAGHIYGHGSDEYYASVTEADRLIGALFEGLDAAGMRENTLVIISSDHGGLGKGHGGASMQEIVIPWIVHGPGVVPGKRLYAPVNIYDTASTVLFALGIEQPVAWIGRPVKSAFRQFSERNLAAVPYIPAPRIAPHGSNALRLDAVLVSMQVDDSEAAIHYAVDGSTPDAASPRYSGAIEVASTSVVRAVALRDGHASPISSASYRIVPDGLEQKVRYAYFEGEWEQLPDFDQLAPVRTGTAYEFDIESVQPRREDYFGVRFESTLRLVQPGRYTFYTRSDDGTRLYVDGQEVVENDGTHGALEESGTLDLPATTVRITVDYFESSGGEHLEVFYKGPDMPRRLLSFSELARQ